MCSGCLAGAGEAGVRVEAVLVVHLALARLVEHIVSFLHALEALFRRFVAGVEVGVVFAGQFSVGLTQFLGGGLFVEAQRFVIVVRGRRHLGLWKKSFEPQRNADKHG